MSNQKLSLSSYASTFNRAFDVAKRILPDIFLHFRTHFVAFSDIQKETLKYLPNRKKNQDFFLIFVSSVLILFSAYSEEFHATWHVPAFLLSTIFLIRIVILIFDHLFFKLIFEMSAPKDRIKVLFFKSNLNSLFLSFGFSIFFLSFIFSFSFFDEFIINLLINVVLTNCNQSLYFDTCFRHENQYLILSVSTGILVCFSMFLALLFRILISAFRWKDINKGVVRRYLINNCKNLIAMSLLIIFTYILIIALFPALNIYTMAIIHIAGILTVIFSKIKN